MSPADAHEELKRLSRLLDKGLDALRDMAREYASMLLTAAALWAHAVLLWLERRQR